MFYNNAKINFNAWYLIKIISPDGSVIEYDYDNLGKLLSKSYTTENEEYQDVTYGYDSSGNRISMNDRTGETLYTYDVLGRVTSVTDGSGQILTGCGKQDENLSEKYFTYDAQNQLSGYIYRSI